MQDKNHYRVSPLSDWLYETDDVYKQLFDLKRKIWDTERDLDGREYKYKQVGNWLQSSYYKSRNALKYHRNVFCQSNRCFLDIGSAPGGLCKYLVEDLSWSGFAVSLPVAEGGNAMEFTHDKLKYRDLDMSAADAYEQLSTWLNEHDARRFHFINMGVLALKKLNVVDKSEIDKFGERTQSNGEALHPVYRNSMCVMLQRLEAGGSTKWLVRESNIAELLRILDLMRQLFDDVKCILGQRAPFDLLCVGFRPEKAKQLLETIERQSLPLNAQDAAYWKCELVEEAERIYGHGKNKALLREVWQNRIEWVRQFPEWRRQQMSRQTNN